MKVHVHVVMDIPAGADADSCVEFVCQSVQGWGGGLAPDDPFFGYRDKKLRVYRISNPKTGKEYREVPS